MCDNICKICMAYMQLHETMVGFLKCPTCAFTKKAKKSMIVLKELNPHSYPTTPEIDANLLIVLEKMNKIRTAYGKIMVVTSGLRDTVQQNTLIAAGKSNAPKSHHLTGEACDILDTDGELHKWCKDNEKILEDIGLWMEERQGVWQHFQIVAPKSGHRWFQP